MRNKKVTLIVQAAMIAAIYVVLTYFISAFNLASGAIQVRISEALTILPYFTPAGIPGLFVGCLLANLLTGAAVYDVVFGSLATLVGAIGTYLLRRHKFLCTLAPVAANVIIIPWVLRYGYGLVVEFGGLDWSIPFYMLTVGAGEIICCCALGTILSNALARVRNVIFKDEN
ncbi:MAG: QueT transporter family protein [Roseburia sp.]